MIVEYILESSSKADPNDIFYKPPSAEEWKKLNDGHHVIVERIDNKEFEKKYLKLQEIGLSVIAAASKEMERADASWETLVNIGMNTVYYTLFPKKRKQQSETYLSNPNPTTATKMMAFVDSKFTYPFINLILPNIKFHLKVFLPKMLPRITIETLDKNADVSEYMREKLEPDSVVSAVKIYSKTYLTKKLQSFSDRYVKVTILSSRPLPKGNAPHTGEKFDRVLIDIHGGGFIATTSRCHQTYLRKWANETDVVIFAVDYKLAPKVKYPYVLDELWQAYFWIVTRAEMEFGVKPRTILLAGDSAGGNLAMSLTLYAIRSKFRVPDGLILGYPALNLSIRSFTPSILTAIDDFILRYSFLNICLNSYIPAEADASKDSYLSPCLIRDEELGQFPPMRIMVAGRDPLRDESYRLMSRLVELGKDAQMIEYRMLPHGFWSFDAIFGLDECKSATDKAIEWIKSLIETHESKLLDK
eukprot:TRINITY_DN5108_c0_g5_i1.p1 TRINITY_DN5108_c0_g5~~TRINITY_DN5108_c0_g5_i1.p1  ORF type:complete len:473 (-),score=128.43 TRINITY_DN5108_c0_g5_i1:60-1478(-)